MAYDEALAERIRSALARSKGVTERKMFGGIGFMVNGHMACGLNGQDLMLRLGEEGAAAAVGEPHARLFDMGGRTIKTMVFVGPEGHATDDALSAWLDKAVTFVRGLPPK